MNGSTDFRKYLQTELLQRCKKNPSYSLRAFAKQLSVDPSTLSKILKGKRPLGSKLIVQLGSRCGLKPGDLKPYLADSLETGSTPSHSYEQIALDRFAIIADWYHFAILELMTVKGFEPSPKWIARTLGISVVEADMAIERLERAGFIEIGKDGKWRDISSGATTTIGPDMASAAHRHFQEQILAKAIKTISTVPLEERDNTGAVMAIDRSKLPEAKALITKFRRQFAKLMATEKNGDDVYNLSVAFFPLTSIPKEKK